MSTPDKQAREALKLHLAYEALPADRGGKNGPKGRAWAAFIEARDTALRTPAEETEAVALAIPVGWYLVPEVPTEEQMNAGLYQSSHDATYEDVCQSYMDMVRTPLDAPRLTTPPPVDEAKVRVTDEMVERALRTYLQSALVPLNKAMRAALEAALSPAPAVDEKRREPTDEQVRHAAAILMQYGLNAPEQVVHQAARAVLDEKRETEDGR